MGTSWEEEDDAVKEGQLLIMTLKYSFEIGTSSFAIPSNVWVGFYVAFYLLQLHFLGV